MLFAAILNLGICEIIHIRYSKMKFSISKHALEKHLNFYSENASVFFNKRMMYMCVKQCLQQPDTLLNHGDSVEITKRFSFTVGLDSDRKRTNESVKVVYIKKKNYFFVITAYPVRNSQKSMHRGK